MYDNDNHDYENSRYDEPCQLVIDKVDIGEKTIYYSYWED